MEEHFYYGKLKSESVDKDECLFLDTQTLSQM